MSINQDPGTVPEKFLEDALLIKSNHQILQPARSSAPITNIIGTSHAASADPRRAETFGPSMDPTPEAKK
jgi:hypothetical protein